jgi:hypothetical protein
MTEHPYWTVATIATGLVALSLIGFIYCLTGWARTRWRHAQLQVQWALDTHATPDERLEEEHRRLLADHHDTDG